MLNPFSAALERFAGLVPMISTDVTRIAESRDGRSPQTHAPAFGESVGHA